MIERLRAARLYFHVPTFLEDVKRLETRQANLEAQVPDDAVIAELKTIQGRLLQLERVPAAAQVGHSGGTGTHRDQVGLRAGRMRSIRCDELLAQRSYHERFPIGASCPTSSASKMRSLMRTNCLS
jgi:hypothetical protein